MKQQFIRVISGDRSGKVFPIIQKEDAQSEFGFIDPEGLNYYVRSEYLSKEEGNYQYIGKQFAEIIDGNFSKVDCKVCNGEGHYFDPNWVYCEKCSTSGVYFIKQPRIEEIKERIRTYHYHNETDDAGDDLFYLLSKLEYIGEVMENMASGNFIAPMGMSQIDLYKQNATALLKSIRE